MQPLAELYTSRFLPTTTLVADPIALLIENETNHFGLLFANACVRNSRDTSLEFEEVTWFRASRKAVQVCTMPRAILGIEQNIHVLREQISGRILPNMSEVPFNLLFLEEYEIRELLRALDNGKGSFVFRWAQEHFGRLPGFRAQANSLTSPENYAAITQFPGMESMTG